MLQAPRSIAELDRVASLPDDEVIRVLEGLSGDVVVAGAGGKMGFHLCRMLRRGFDAIHHRGEVIAVSRFSDSATRDAFEKNGIRSLALDLTKAANVGQMPDAEAVFFLAGIKFGTSQSPDTLRLFNETMPGLVAERYAGVPTVALSTGCVYPFVAPESGGCTEIDSVAPAGAYAVSCLGRETAFAESSRVHGTPLSLIRLNYSVDLRYGVLVDLALKVFADEPVDVEMGYFNCIWQGDAIRHTIRALEHANASPDPFVLNVTGGQTLSVREIAAHFAAHFGKPVTISGTEAESAWLSNAEKSHRLFGRPTIEEATLVEWVADWIQSNRPTLGKPTHFQTRDGNY
jgi:nucleoside-diphosphate-sugar epimerase